MKFGPFGVVKTTLNLFDEDITTVKLGIMFQQSLNLNINSVVLVCGTRANVSEPFPYCRLPFLTHHLSSQKGCPQIGHA